MFDVQVISTINPKGESQVIVSGQSFVLPFRGKVDSTVLKSLINYHENELVEVGIIELDEDMSDEFIGTDIELSAYELSVGSKNTIEKPTGGFLTEDSSSASAEVRTESKGRGRKASAPETKTEEVKIEADNKSETKTEADNKSETKTEEVKIETKTEEVKS